MNIKLNGIKLIANTAPWLSPIPSSYFVARSSIQHLDIPLIMGVVIGLIIETLGFSSVHLYIILLQWNIEKKKTDPKAPATLALILVFLYLVITISLSVILEVVPKLSVFVPAIFPPLALIGAFILSLISQQEQRQLAVSQMKLERSAKRFSQSGSEQGKASNLANLDTNLDLANEVRKNNKYTLLERLENVISEHPEKGVTELKNLLGVRSRSTVYAYIKELEAMGRLKKTQEINS